MTEAEFKSKVGLALSNIERGTWGDFLEAVWQIHLEASNQWIPVEKELPEKMSNPRVISKNVLVRCDGDYMVSAVYDHLDKEWLDTGIYTQVEGVTHWTEIMPPRKEE